jgi:hypothetical protein
MNQYDRFEIYEDYSMMWRGCVQGAQPAIATLKAMGHQTHNECFATNLQTKEVIGRVNEISGGIRPILNKSSLNRIKLPFEANAISQKSD